MPRIVGVLALFGAVACAPCALAHRQRAEGGPTLVVLVRHAEKAVVPGDDPPLSDLGTARAQALQDALRGARPSAIVVSSRQRTALTAAEVVRATGVQAITIPVGDAGAAHVQSVAAAVRAQRGVVLVVGHSNTVPAVITALGGPALPDICDATYSQLFVLTPARADRPASLVVARYGAHEAPPPASCGGMLPRE
jgi:phosphohistidine phosphatase SixA